MLGNDKMTRCKKKTKAIIPAFDILFHIQGEIFIGRARVTLNMWVESNAAHTIIFNIDSQGIFILLEYYDIATF